MLFLMMAVEGVAGQAAKAETATAPVVGDGARSISRRSRGEARSGVVSVRWRPYPSIALERLAAALIPGRCDFAAYHRCIFSESSACYQQ